VLLPEIAGLCYRAMPPALCLTELVSSTKSWLCLLGAHHGIEAAAAHIAGSTLHVGGQFSRLEFTPSGADSYPAARRRMSSERELVYLGHVGCRIKSRYSKADDTQR
jgi:hypothetical protein